LIYLLLDSPPTNADADLGYLSSASEGGKKNPTSNFKQPLDVKPETKKFSHYAAERKYSVMDVDEDERPIGGASGSFTNPLHKMTDVDVEMKPEMKPTTRQRWHSNPEQDKVWTRFTLIVHVKCLHSVTYVWYLE
jgi:hypothetical protein